MLENKSDLDGQVPTFLAQCPPQIWNTEWCYHLQIYNLDREMVAFARRHQILSSKVAGVKDFVKKLRDSYMYLINEEYWLALSNKYSFDDTMFTG